MKDLEQQRGYIKVFEPQNAIKHVERKSTDQISKIVSATLDPKTAKLKPMTPEFFDMEKNPNIYEAYKIIYEMQKTYYQNRNLKVWRPAPT